MAKYLEKELIEIEWKDGKPLPIKKISKLELNQVGQLKKIPFEEDKSGEKIHTYMRQANDELLSLGTREYLRYELRSCGANNEDPDWRYLVIDKLF